MAKAKKASMLSKMMKEEGKEKEHKSMKKGSGKKAKC